ncbi:ferrous iron transport protein B [Polycladomyces subterraneus]|uniref:Ferrous iron transport protein B n=1 Tax=Polycladomyces subterraneus TaxID=1016997 RepID=A0ABT8IJ10_9BACL|nr:ferrous iron transport protein B [Polycladomyces subterraneus]MDN4592367.1 ferrous iron transport protein B [Polycladomyces subterraneus]
MNKSLALVGNPNAGKTSLFNILTGTRQYVGNWPGVTVEKKEGLIKKLPEYVLVDLPGIYSLSAQSLEEQLAVTYLLKESPHTLINIVDASNLERNLYLSVQLLEMGLPSVICLNMMDIAKDRGLQIDIPALAKILGAVVVPMVARKANGHDKLIDLLREGVQNATLTVPYPTEVEAAIRDLDTLLASSPWNFRTSRRWLALMWLEGNETVEEILRHQLPAELIQQMEAVRAAYPAAIEHRIRNARYDFIEKIICEVTQQSQNPAGRTWSDRIDSLLLHPVLGIPIFLGFMYLIFQITFSWIGTSLSDQLDEWISGPLTDWLKAGLTAMSSPDWFTQLMTDGVLAGVGSVLVFLPQIGILFFCLSFLEDSGYMARAAVLMDRFMSMIGLNGKAFIPLILGFGCNVPAIMATRTLEDPKSRLITALISPFMSCSARLSVYSLFVAAFFKHGGAAVVFTLYVTGIVVAILTAFLLKKFVHAEEGTFLLEIPPYRAPMLKSLFLHTWDKAKGFVRKAGTIIFGMSVLIWFLGHFSWHGFAPIEHSWLAAIGGLIAPLFAPLGFATWQAGVSLVTGFLAKEVVVSTMSIVYGAGDDGKLGDLLHHTFTQPVALAFLFFVLLYTPCVSTVVMMWRETGSSKWTLISVGYSVAIAWVVAFVVYHISQLIF